MENINVMKQNEHYNLNSTPQLVAIQNSFTYIKRAVEEHRVDYNHDDIFFIVDYGCSHGANSAVAIETIVNALKKKYGTSLIKRICTVFNDLPTNDWSTLFRITANLPVSSLASSRSFYEQIIPSNTVQFGYTATAIHWLSKKPCNLPRHCFCLAGQSTVEELALWRAQAANDYRAFLQHRSNEMKSGAVLLCVTLSRDDTNDTKNLPVYHNLYRSAMTVLDEEELLNYNIQSYYRSIEEQVDPALMDEYHFEVISADLHLLPHVIYEDYRSNNLNFEEFIDAFTEFVRSWSESNLIHCFRKDRSENERTQLIENFWKEFRNGIRQQGADQFKNNPYRSYILLRKR